MKNQNNLEKTFNHVETPEVVYSHGLGRVRDLIPQIPELKKNRVLFFFDGAREKSYEEVQILSSLGIYSGIVIHEKSNWEKLTDLLYYALCSRAPHAPIEPFQYAFDTYQRNKLVDYGTVSSLVTRHLSLYHSSLHPFFYEATPCAACAGWRVCLGKYAKTEDKSGCSAFSTELLTLIDSIKYY